MPVRLPGWVGARPGRFGVTLVTGFTGFGALACLFTGSGPGLLLDVCMLTGTVLAVLMVRPRAAHLIIPVPALMYLIAALAAGYAADHATDTSHTALLVSAAQWVAGGFLPMIAATLLVLAVTVGYWLVYWRTSRRSAGHQDPAGPASRRYRDPRDDWGGPATSRYPADDDYPADDSWPSWGPPSDR